MSALHGKCILVVEDEALIAMLVEDILSDLGANVVGPAGSIDQALAIAASCQIDAAVLDVNIRGRTIDPVAALLLGRGIPIVFATGYGQNASVRIHGMPIIEKPYTADRIAEALNIALAATHQPDR